MGNALVRGRLLQIKGAKIDRLEHERRKSSVADSIGKHAAGEREEKARRFGQQEGLKLFGIDVADAEQPAIGKLDLKGDLVGGWPCH
mgnify:CR=1 FL=1